MLIASYPVSLHRPGPFRDVLRAVARRTFSRPHLLLSALSEEPLQALGVRPCCRLALALHQAPPARHVAAVLPCPPLHRTSFLSFWLELFLELSISLIPSGPATQVLFPLIDSLCHVLSI